LVNQSGDWAPVYFNMFEGKSSSAAEFLEKQLSSGRLSESTLEQLLKRIGERP
jgi:hypothetical protein